MTAAQKIKWKILLGYGNEYLEEGVAITPEYIDESFAIAKKYICLSYRSEGIKTDLFAPYSRNYECEIVADEMPDGSWVAWPYWHGGGKHGDPGSIPWIEDAFEVETWETTKVVRCFRKKVG